MMERSTIEPVLPPKARRPAPLEIESAVREADPWAFPVASRIVRRVIRQEVDVPSLGRIPHRKCFVVSSESVRDILAPEELGLEPGAAWPPVLILLARPDEHELEAMSAGALAEHYRRLDFHSRVHLALEERRASGALDESAVQDRIDRIGRTVFAEIQAVLDHEGFLLPPVSDQSVYSEFAALFLELRYFAADLLGSYFPSLDDLERVESILREDVDADQLLERTSLLSAFDGAFPEGSQQRRSAPRRRQGVPSVRISERQLRNAAIAARRGNDVRAAILHARAADSRDPEIAERAAESAAANLRRLGERLRRALELDQQSVAAWQELLPALLSRAVRGFWNPDARLLYDLQRVCLDFERESYVIDLAGWLRSFGRRPLKRPLPAQREVLMSKHLRIAAKRLAKAQVSAGQREHLAILLHQAGVAAEGRLRERLRPVLVGTLTEVGFVPLNLPERVSFRKLVEEMLDAVVAGGYFTMGDLRDTIARNNLKLDDVADPLELVVGDRLLRADRRLAEVLDGVYQPGPFYIRWLQGFSSCAFGTRWGRLLTLYAFIPFGGAYVALAGLDHLVALIRHLTTYLEGADSAGSHPRHHAHLTQPYFVILLGLLVLGLMHNQLVRNSVWSAVSGLGRGLHLLLWELPRWLSNVTGLSRFLRSPLVTSLRKRLLNSALLTAFFCWLLPALRWYEYPRPSATALVFLALAVLFNSRAGRDIEELAAERMQLAWHRFRVLVLVAAFDLIMDSFKQLLEGLERVMYEVDEWLRFKSGETGLTLAVKAVLGLVWSIVDFFIRFFVTVLIEPQINPIKHFPVVTVSHKIIAPVLFMPLSKQLIPVLGEVLGGALATTTVFLLPGMFGFLVWELRGNWRLYAVNRYQTLKPVAIGSHGETMLRLLRVGLHSGTLPRLFGRLRRAARRGDSAERWRNLMRYYDQLHHIEVDVRRFVERELVAYFAESAALRDLCVRVGEIEAGTNSLRIDVLESRHEQEPLQLAFAEQGGRIVASIRHPGWTRNLSAHQCAALAGLLVGWYRMAAVSFVREQILDCLGLETLPFGVTEAGLVLLPNAKRKVALLYPFDDRSELVPVPWTGDGTATSTPAVSATTQRRTVQPAQSAPAVRAEALIFARTRTTWSDWVEAWTRDESSEPFPDLLAPDARAEALLGAWSPEANGNSG